jgi:hypothetical protein
MSYPTATVTVPAGGITINSLPIFSGSVADPNPNIADPGSAASGVSAVEVFLQSQQNGAYFNGAGFLSALRISLTCSFLRESTSGRPGFSQNSTVTSGYEVPFARSPLR